MYNEKTLMDVFGGFPEYYPGLERVVFGLNKDYIIDRIRDLSKSRRTTELFFSFMTGGYIGNRGVLAGYFRLFFSETTLFKEVVGAEDDEVGFRSVRRYCFDIEREPQDNSFTLRPTKLLLSMRLEEVMREFIVDSFGYPFGSEQYMEEWKSFNEIIYDIGHLLRLEIYELIQSFIPKYKTRLVISFELSSVEDEQLILYNFRNGKGLVYE